MRLIKTTPTYEVWKDYFEGVEVLFTKDLKTQEIHMNAESLAKIMGYGSLEDMLGNDEVLDLMNEVKEETGVFPIVKKQF